MHHLGRQRFRKATEPACTTYVHVHVLMYIPSDDRTDPDRCQSRWDIVLTEESTREAETGVAIVNLYG